LSASFPILHCVVLDLQPQRLENQRTGGIILLNCRDDYRLLPAFLEVNMTEEILISLALIIILGIFGQWVGWRIRLPAILILLLFGLIAGPITGLIHPDAVLGDLVFPIVSLSVALILFEGGLSLRLSELRETGHAVRNLVTLGALVVWAVVGLSAYWILGLSRELSVLLGAILIVSGPTVVQPLLLYVRPTRRIFNILKWEGIVIDPVGATLAVLTLQIVVSGTSGQAALGIVAFGVLKTILSGVLIGILAGVILVALIRNYLLPEFLQNPTALVMVLAAYTIADMLVKESGLLAVTVMGILMANQRKVDIRHIVEFKENLRTLLLSGLFILLAARINLNTLIGEMRWPTLVFMLVVIFISRPLSVLVSTLKTGLSWRERGFLAWMAPRGIVAASVSAVFGLHLAEAGIPGAERLAPITFLVIITTVLVYGLTAMPVARWLKVSQPSPQGALIVGAHPWAIQIGLALKQAGLRVLMVDTNPLNAQAAAHAGLETYTGSVLAEEFLNEVDLTGIGRMLALTSNMEVNSLAAIRLGEVFGRNEVYQLCSPAQSGVSQELCGRALFSNKVDFSWLQRQFENASSLHTLEFNGGFTAARLREFSREDCMPLFLLTENGHMQVYSGEMELQPRPTQKAICLVSPKFMAQAASQPASEPARSENKSPALR
jgi:NhaP-type Na+/H+ or K+/H+ antiporter